jgi:hypothetical protein
LLMLRNLSTISKKSWLEWLVGIGFVDFWYSYTHQYNSD